MKALLLINGLPPRELPDLEQYDRIYCTDGAYAHLLAKRIRPDYVIGDFDSVEVEDISPFVNIIVRPDQDFTDFDKCLQVIENHGFAEVDVYGSTGLEHDHFLGNISTALEYKKRLDITFYDDYSIFFFTSKNIELEGVKDHVISLLPFPVAKNVNSSGLMYALDGMDLKFGSRVGTRNIALEDTVEITYEKGNLLVFISKYQKEPREINRMWEEE